MRKVILTGEQHQAVDFRRVLRGNPDPFRASDRLLVEWWDLGTMVVLKSASRRCRLAQRQRASFDQVLDAHGRAALRTTEERA